MLRVGTSQRQLELGQRIPSGHGGVPPAGHLVRQRGELADCGVTACLGGRLLHLVTYDVTLPREIVAGALGAMDEVQGGAFALGALDSLPSRPSELRMVDPAADRARVAG